MGQVAIVNVGGEYFREYEIEKGDWLSRICARYGHADWRTVYNHPVNASFRASFPDPNKIGYVKAEHLFIPLVVPKSVGPKKKGKPPEDYIVVRVFDEIGVPQLELPLVVIPPGAPHEGLETSTSLDGDIIWSSPEPGDWYLTSAEYELVPLAMSGAAYPVQDVDSFGSAGAGGAPDTAYHLPLPINSTTDVVARRIFYLDCPMCGITYKTVSKPAGGPDNLCPKDDFNLSDIEEQVLVDPESYTDPTGGTTPQEYEKITDANVASLKCRGTRQMGTAHGQVTVYWDESRFVKPDGGDYTLWGTEPGGAAKSVRITGRTTWGAEAPRLGPGRVYEFHTTPRPGDKLPDPPSPYTGNTIPSNKINPLDSVLFWITVHHTTDKAASSYDTAVRLQQKHFKSIANAGPGADIGYHFIIDANGDIYEARPLGIKGSHAELFNGGNVGIVMAGDFESRLANGFSPDKPTASAIESLEKLVDVLASRFRIASVWSHRKRATQVGKPEDFTECPGGELLDEVENKLRGRYPGPPE